MIIQRFNALTTEESTAPLLPIIFGDHDGMTEGLTYWAVLSHRPQSVQSRSNVLPAMTLEATKLAFMKTRGVGQDWFPVATAKSAHDALDLLMHRCEEYKPLDLTLHRTIIWYLTTTMGARLNCRTLDAVEKDLVVPTIQDILNNAKPTDDEFTSGKAWGMWTDPLYMTDNME